ncbi:hypothetical protein FA95DRAFT_312771 [Auriscalpium vulgare]|uniref:Uncharacterized protein n=1 Tax=Auriscalpium vulgare TaxID=40419 RepID=A0ACB8S5Y8_9AGAM|nr:hypothetical protein FA95DRAFT_312771 [Auriscalpium vulgare]
MRYQLTVHSSCIRGRSSRSGRWLSMSSRVSRSVRMLRRAFRHERPPILPRHSRFLTWRRPHMKKTSQAQLSPFPLSLAHDRDIVWLDDVIYSRSGHIAPAAEFAAP